jgi:hypothetical protein
MDQATPQKKPAVRIEMDDDFARAVEDWRRRQPVIPSKAQALRLLAARSLAAEHAAA